MEKCVSLMLNLRCHSAIQEGQVLFLISYLRMAIRIYTDLKWESIPPLVPAFFTLGLFLPLAPACMQEMARIKKEGLIFQA